MIKRQDRNYISRLLKQYKEETGREATSGGDISKDFLNWRKNKEKENE